MLFTTSPLTTWAGDNTVNCRTVKVAEQHQYMGWANCSVTVYDPQGYPELHNLSQYFDVTNIQRKQLSRYIYNGYYSCNADVPYYNTIDITKTVCDYTPQSSFYYSQTPNNLTGSNIVSVTSNSSDRDGHIVKYEWWEDNKKVGGDSHTLRLASHYGKTIQLKLIVTDNQGYTDTTVKTVVIKPWECDRSCNLH